MSDYLKKTIYCVKNWANVTVNIYIIIIVNFIFRKTEYMVEWLVCRCSQKLKKCRHQFLNTPKYNDKNRLILQ